MEKELEDAIVQSVQSLSVWDQWLVRLWMKGLYVPEVKKHLEKYIHPIRFEELRTKIEQRYCSLTESIIEHCFSCPYSNIQNDNKTLCSRLLHPRNIDDDKLITMEKYIPAWCPLPVAEVLKEASNYMLQLSNAEKLD